VKAATAHATLVASLGVLPSFLTGSLVPQLRHDFGIDAAHIGLATASLFVSAALLAPIGARLCRRLGTNRSMIIAPATSLVALGTGALAPDFGWLVAALVVGGIANAIAQPVSNIRLAEFVTSHRLGFAFGLKQAAVPFAALFSGAAVPSVAVVFGWRWAWFAAAVAAAMIVAYGILRRDESPPLWHTDGSALRGRDRLSRRTMVIVTAGAFVAATVGTSVGVFFTDSAVSTGLDPGVAGTVYALFSAVAATTRILLGWYSDRHPGIDSYLLAMCLLGIGVVGNVLFAMQFGWALIAGALLSYALGWAWPGLLQWSIVRDNRRVMHAATGFFQSGSSLGAGVGPIFFGAVVSASSYQTGWLTAAGLGLVATALLAIGTLSARVEVRPAAEEQG
jgi:MFS family permease